jgi:hypothetical protein
MKKWEGRYRPAAQEQIQHNVPRPAFTIPLPQPERLIWCVARRLCITVLWLSGKLCFTTMTIGYKSSLNFGIIDHPVRWKSEKAVIGQQLKNRYNTMYQGQLLPSRCRSLRDSSDAWQKDFVLQCCDCQTNVVLQYWLQVINLVSVAAFLIIGTKKRKQEGHCRLAAQE